MKRSLVLDIDGVLCDHAIAICNRVNDDYGISSRSEDVSERDYRFNENITFGEAANLYYQDEDFVKGMRTTEGAQSFVSESKGQYDLSIATTRFEKTHEWTEDWIRTHFGLGIKTYFVKSKSELCPDILVDDNEDEILSLLDIGGIGILFLRPWNTNTLKYERIVKSSNSFAVSDPITLKANDTG